ncbi:hypothetical protein ANOM_007490 [Aspergillus nomiae NRRL 13137]|uniref:Uncharacterized protein n=1 Tax=Aspergillus nomiae NRRL (strain ATCC 15546 / NRRL 13137 / CBS 260.88 / M93) TaxID=1509407 RepID=A0A0L1J1V3_ASPN3|nr:uncharacterized protein ANOM_007490 [Aspergillus nomiae NRRL 13137]KNG85393.1 hypothetical protein ANOM_007490 [Aspergillus nomiae NRRL 13137]
MSNQTMNKKSWESLSSTFSGLDISLSQDSCYASDEVSVASTNPTTVNSSVVSSVTPTTATTDRPYLKPILKRRYAEIADDGESESGYASGASEQEFEFLSEDDSDSDSDSDSDDDEVYYVTCWEDESDSMSEYSEDDDNDYDYDDDSADGSFISFGSNNVRFDTNVLYIEAPELQEEEEEAPCTELTCHELMEMARASGSLQIQEGNDIGDDVEDPEHGSISDSIKQLPEEHPSDVVDLDKRLFIAYMNGINGIANPGYKSRLHARVGDIKMGRVKSPYLEADNVDGVYLDHALNHVIGTFPNLIAKQEFDELLSLSEEKGALEQPAATRESLNLSLLKKIEVLLSERLASDVKIGHDELSFFAGGVAYALENWKPYMVH